MRETLLEILREPGTGAEFDLVASRGSGGRVEVGRLVARGSGREYAIENGIPRFAPRDNYTGSFGLQWNLFQEVQLDHENGLDHSRRRFDAEAGWTEQVLRGKWVLDAGCGAGRFAAIAAARGPNLVALDYSSAVDAAKKTLAAFDNVDIVQASLLEPPFAPSTFDYAYCIGVIQHTPDPKAVVANVAGLVKRGGEFSMTIYARRPWTKLNAKYLIRPLTKRLPPRALLRGIQSTMPVLFPLTDALFRLPVLGRVAQFTIPVANYVHLLDDRELRYRTAVLDTFDMLAPQFDDPMTAAEVTTVLREVGTQRVEFRTRVPINVVGVR
jgi:SAM-dependent methyltransferase